MLSEYKRLAVQTGYPGGGEAARIPWQTAVTGAECAPRANEDSLYWTKEMHINADVLLAQRVLHRLQRNSTFLKNIWPMLSGVCHFLAAFMTLDQSSRNYTIEGVLPTTEHGIVDNPVYSIAASTLSLQFCVDSAKELGISVPSNWSHIASRPYLPLNRTAYAGGPVHQVYSWPAYDGGSLAQAGVAFLQYPLQLPMDPALAKRDLEYYSTKFGANMMFFGRLVYAINWLRTVPPVRKHADEVFELGFSHQVGAWNVWREHKPTGPSSPGDGAVNFLTGSGAFLQVCCYARVIARACLHSPILIGFDTDCRAFSLAMLDYRHKLPHWS